MDDEPWQPEDIPFTAVPGPLNGAADLQSDNPADFLQLILTNELLQHIVEQTNVYAEQVISTVTDKPVKDWKPFTVEELKTFLGLLFLTGIIQKPELDMHWSTDEGFATPYFGKTMARNRFQLINTRANFGDRLWKVRPALDYLVNKI